MKNKLIFVFVVIYLGFLFCEKEDSYFGKEYNEYRKSLNAPTIKENMRLTLSSKTDAYWVVPNIHKIKGAVHASKAISIIDIEGKNWHETDRFRNNLNDSVFEQILIHPYYINDSIYWSSSGPSYFQMYTERTRKASTNEADSQRYQEKLDLTRRFISLTEVDSILNTWGLSR